MVIGGPCAHLTKLGSPPTARSRLHGLLRVAQKRCKSVVGEGLSAVPTVVLQAPEESGRAAQTLGGLQARAGPYGPAGPRCPFQPLRERLLALVLSWVLT